MIQIPTLPNPLGTKVKHDDLIFTASDARKSRVTINDFSIIVCENDPKVYISTLANCMEIDKVRLPYYLQHTDLFENAQKIFTDNFGVEPDVLLASVYKTDFSKSSFLFANRKHIENALKGVDNVCDFDLNKTNEATKVLNKIKTEAKERELKYFSIEKDKLTFTLPNRVFPVVGTYNDLSFDSNPNFNLIFGSFLQQEIYDINKEETKKTNTINSNDNLKESNLKDDDSNPSLWISHFDEKIKALFKVGIPLYCIKKFDLHNSDYITKKEKEVVVIPGFDNYDPWDMSAFYESINRQTVTKFNEVIVNLLLGYNRASFLTIDIDAFVATMADFYELDRTPATVEYSISLQAKLSKKFAKASYFAGNIRKLTMKHFIEFFIVESIIDFSDFIEDPAKEIRHAMAEKYETTKLIGNRQILTGFLNDELPNSKYKPYLAGHIQAKKDISKWI